MTTTPSPSITTHPLTGDGRGPFTTGWTYGEAADVQAWIEVAGLAQPPLSNVSDYTLTAADPLTSGGTVLLSLAAMPVGGWAGDSILVLARRTVRRQSVALPDTEGHKPRATERALDKQMRIAQEDGDTLSRALLAPIGQAPPNPKDVIDAATLIGTRAAKSFNRGASGAQTTDLLAYLLTQAPSPIEFDAAADGVQDDGEALQALVDAAWDERSPALVLSRSYYVNSLIQVPRGVTLDGVASDGEWARNAVARDQVGTLIFGPAGGLVLNEGSALRRLNVVSSKASSPPASLAALVATIATWTDTAVQINGPDVTVDECLIMGFADAVETNHNERWTLTRNKIDCLSGLDLANTYDTGRAQSNQVWPFYGAHRFGGDAVAGALSRPGRGIWLHDGADGSLVTDNLVYGYQAGIDLEDVYACHVIGNWVDNAITAPATATAVGIRTQGLARLCKINMNHVDSHGVNYDLQHDVGVGVSFTGNVSGQAVTHKLRLGQGHGQVWGWTSAGPCAGAEIVAVAGCGEWDIDGVRVYDSLAPTLIDCAVADRFKLSIGRVSTINAPAFDPRQWTTWVRAAKAADQALPGGDVETALTYVESIDSLNEFDGATGTFTATVSGFYDVDLQWGVVPSVGATHNFGVYVKVNGTQERREQVVIVNDGLRADGLNARLWLSAGQTISLKATSGQPGTLPSGFINSVTISRAGRGA